MPSHRTTQRRRRAPGTKTRKLRHPSMIARSKATKDYFRLMYKGGGQSETRRLIKAMHKDPRYKSLVAMYLAKL